MAEIFGYPIMGGGGGTGGTLTVTGVAGSTVTASKDGKSYTRTLDSNGKAVFKGLSSGTWTLTMSNGTQTATRTVTVTADYAVTITYFSATINVTYPAGSTCTAKNGATTLTAPNTTGTWACAVPNAGTWTVTCTNGTKTATDTVSVATAGQNVNVTLAYVLYLYNNGDECTEATGGWRVNVNIPESTAKESNRIWTGELKNSGNKSWIYMKNPSSDIKKYDTLKIQINRTKIVDVPSFGLMSGATPPENINDNNKNSLYIAYKNIGSSNGTITLDISNATADSMRVMILSLYSSYIYKIWLE